MKKEDDGSDFSEYMRCMALHTLRPRFDLDTSCPNFIDYESEMKTKGLAPSLDTCIAYGERQRHTANEVIRTLNDMKGKHGQSLNNKRIVVADDDPVTLKITRAQLARLGCEEVKAVLTAGEAMEALRKEKFNFALLDNDFGPDHLSGETAIKQLREEGFTGVIFGHTAYPSTHFTQSVESGHFGVVLIAKAGS